MSQTLTLYLGAQARMKLPSGLPTQNKSPAAISPLRDPRKCSHPSGHCVDNQGYCHCCGVPLNLDYLAAWTGNYAEALGILEAYEKECSDYVSTLESEGTK